MTQKWPGRPISGLQGDEKALPLSPEERQLIALIVDGHTNRGAARYFSLCERTIYRRMVRIRSKLGVSNRFELMLFAIEHGIIDQSQRRS